MSVEPRLHLSVEPLAWDSGFFGFDVGALSLDDTANPSKVRTALQFPGNARYRLIVVSHSSGHPDLRQAVADAGGQLVDVKFDYRANVSSGLYRSDHVDTVPAATTAAEIETLNSLALISGEHSRFRTDPRIGKENWSRLYGLWVENSLSSAIADIVLVHRDAGRITGFVTIKARDEQARIGLIAVDPACQGMGIGRELITAAHAWAAQQKLASIFVATQQDNIGACRFYTRMGFSLATQTDIHHLWTTS